MKRLSALGEDCSSQPRIWVRLSLLTIGLAIGSLLFWSASARAADHRDAPTVDGIPQGDVTDLFAFLDPNNPDDVVLIMNVNPFSVPAELPGYAFSNDLLYQFKIDNTGDAVEDLVIEVIFTTTSAGQMVKVFGPTKPQVTGARAVPPQGQPSVLGAVNTVLSGNGGMTVFAGTRDDPFVTDVGQLFRILTGAQDVFRDYPNAPLLGHLRGRALLPTPVGGNSGVDGFGGFNVSSIQVELPASMIKGATSEVNIWATVSRPDVQTNNPGGTHDSANFLQFERMGQQLIATVFVPSSMRDAFNFATPDKDVAMFSSLIPNALTSTDPSGNTTAGRATVLHSLKLDGTVVGRSNGGVGEIEGAPLLLGNNFQNTDPNLIRKAVLPDVIRLDLSVTPPNDIPPKGVGIIGPSNMVGLQDGRRPGDAVTDILLQLSRQLADVTFPKGSGLPGASSDGTVRPGSLDCSSLPCPDRRVLAVLDGTDFIRPDVGIVALSLGDSANDLPLSTSFPFLASEHPLPGNPGTVDFPPQEANP
jgi:hypothetical protein